MRVSTLPAPLHHLCYWYYRRGLVMQIEPMAKDVPLSAMAADNERLLAQYRPPVLATIQARTFKRVIVAEYAPPAYCVGQEYERAKRFREAQAWYERALAIDPELKAARDALAALPP